MSSVNVIVMWYVTCKSLVYTFTERLSTKLVLGAEALMRFQWNASTLARFSYFILVLILGLLLLVSCVFLLSQAVRTAPNRSWFGNVNALIVGAAYIVVVRLYAHKSIVRISHMSWCSSLYHWPFV